MALKIRLRQQGRANRRFYRLVVTDSRSPRDGKFVEILGWYNPVETKEELTLSVNSERVQHWLDNGAELSDRAEILVKRSNPEIVKNLNEKKLARNLKITAKKRELRRKKHQEV